MISIKLWTYVKANGKKHTLNESRGSLLSVECCLALARLSTSSTKTQMNVSFSVSSINSIAPNIFPTSLPLSPKYLLKSECASISTSLVHGYWPLSRIESCCAKARQREVLPVPLGPYNNAIRFHLALLWVSWRAENDTKNFQLQLGISSLAESCTDTCGWWSSATWNGRGPRRSDCGPDQRIVGRKKMIAYEVQTPSKSLLGSSITSACGTSSPDSFPAFSPSLFFFKKSAGRASCFWDWSKWKTFTIMFASWIVIIVPTSLLDVMSAMLMNSRSFELCIPATISET